MLSCRMKGFLHIMLSICCVLITVGGSSGTFIPGQRCLCPETQSKVRGQVKGLKVYPKGPNCDQDTVIVTLKRNNAKVCLNPMAPMGKHLIRCLNRVTRLNGDVKQCLRRRRSSRQLSGKRSRAHNIRSTPSGAV